MLREDSAGMATATTDGAEAANGADPVEAPADDGLGEERRGFPAVRSPRTILAVVGVTIAGAVAISALTAKQTVSGPLLDRSEPVAMRLRPRKVLWRYLTTLGLWEAARRRTRYTLTDSHLVVEKGFANRRVSALPLARVTGVSVRTGAWQGFVDVVGPDRDETTFAAIGPLRSPVARRLGEAIAHAAYGR